MKNRLFYLGKINIAKVVVLGCIFIMSLFAGTTVAAANEEPVVNIVSSTYKGNVTGANAYKAQTINGITYIQGTGISGKDGITFEITNAYNTIDDYTAIAIWEQGFSSSAGLEFQDYDRWYINRLECPDENYPVCIAQLDNSVDKNQIALDSDDNYITYNYNKFVYYIVESRNNKDSDDVVTEVDFSQFFTSDKKITYTYRIRNLISANANGEPSFGFKEIYVNFWKATGEEPVDDNSSSLTIQYGLAQPVSDVESHTNGTDGNTYSDDNQIVCSEHADYICVDYVDSNGVPSESTTREQLVNIYVPNTVLYTHATTTSDSIKDSYKDIDGITSTVKQSNSIYAINYFCEGSSIRPATLTYSGNTYNVSCGSDPLREYLYVDGGLVGTDIRSVTSFENAQEFFKAVPYQMTLTVDSRGNYVVVITDLFGNINTKAVINVEDIINQALLAYFQKSNAKEDVRDVNGWFANEYVTNSDVYVSITMSATTVIKVGLPVIAAETTLLDSEYVKQVRYWRVDGSLYDSDVCAEDVGTGCAIKPSDANSILLYSRASTTAAPVPGSDWESFSGNVMTMRIASNGRYRFYIETFAGNNTDNDGANPITGEQKNPRVEVYKIDKKAPDIKFGGPTDSNCPSGTCKYVENTYPYYQGTGNTSGSVINKLVTGTEGSIQIDYSKNSIYYVTAQGDPSKTSILSSASDADKFFTYLTGLFNSGTYLSELLQKYNGDTELYAHSTFTAGGVLYTKLDDNGLSSMSEEQYRRFIISNNIEYTAYSLATNYGLLINVDAARYELEQNNINVEYIDHSDGTTPICDKLGVLKVNLNNDAEIDQRDCVNYYLDHGIDFDIKITVYDVVEEVLKDNDDQIVKDANGKYSLINVLGNSSVRTIHVDVVDNTAPGFSSILNNYNVGTDCRVELGNRIGATAGQDTNMLLNCYGVTTKTADEPPATIYNFEDNVFTSSFVQTQNVNVRNNVNMYILSKETNKWVSLVNGYVPNRSGKYAMLIIINDNASGNTVFDLSGQNYHGQVVATDSSITVSGNAIGVLVSYYVDKKIVLISPQNNVKNYGDADPVFRYCVDINKNTLGIREYLEAPFRDMDVFTSVGCAQYNADNTSVSLTSASLAELFQGNASYATFSGALTRQESGIYNDKQYDEASNVINNYVGLYKIVLGTLNITGNYADGDDLSGDYIIKINPNVRSETVQLYKQENKCNLVDSQYTLSGEYVDKNEAAYAGCYDFNEDDDFFVESTAVFTINQVVLVVSANGSQKEYGNVDPNYDNSNLNDTNNKITASANAYLNGYSVISGLKYSDTVGVVLGVLRRQTGENVGLYAICNYRGIEYNDAALTDTILENPNNMLVVGGGTQASCASPVDPYAGIEVSADSYNNGIIIIDAGYINSRALYIETNKVVTGYKTLNVTTAERDNNYANYLIKYQANTFSINPATMIVQPTPGQRREYSYNGVDEVNPWEIVVYGKKDFSVSNNEVFNGYTENSASYAIRTGNDEKSIDTIGAALDEEHYNNATETRASWKLIKDSKTYTGFKTNETYSLFNGRLALVSGTYTLDETEGLYLNMNAGWYAFDTLATDRSTLTIVGNSRNQCDYTDYVSTTGMAYSSECRNYNLVLDLEYRTLDGYQDGDTDNNGDTVEVVYRSKMGYCRTTTLGDVSDVDVQCSSDIDSEILFEVYRREIILEFNSLLEKVPSDNTDIVYGKRYDYYETNLFKIEEGSANEDYLENFLFYCYPSYESGLVGTVTNPTDTCTTNPWYGLTEGDSWDNIGLEFHLHSAVSDPDEEYYTTGSDKAIPAGRYYVYSTISATQNYKYNYLGGTFTIKTKTVGLVMTDYSKEYGNVYYTNENCLIKDGSLLSGATTLINDCLGETESTLNTVNNTYGFTIKDTGLDSKDNIADNFIGRPLRVTEVNTSLDVNGLQENVGIYTISDGTIKSKHNNGFNDSCTDLFVGDEAAGCVVVGGTGPLINNYMVHNDPSYTLTYYLLKNGTAANSLDYSSEAVTTIVRPEDKVVENATLTITPATITIKVSAGQTKMYGCAYNSINTTSAYAYTYADGYSGCVTGTGLNYDLGYAYSVYGDKDYYIYNYGYYAEDFDQVDVHYTSDAINEVYKDGNEVKLDSSLIDQYALRNGLRSTALNGGVLYRVENSLYNNAISYSSIVAAANDAQSDDSPTYQGQSVGSYIITLGNLNAALTSIYEDEYVEAYNKVCNASNEPGAGSEICRNYIISYYGATSIEDTHTYDAADSDDLVFTITTRVAFIYAKYNSKIYGNLEPVVKITCDEDLVNAGVCATEGVEITLGITEYYTKDNSLAKAPYVASIDTSGNIAHEYDSDSVINDKQVNVVRGSVSRKGEEDGVSNVDDIVGVYNFIFDSVVTTTYASSNYVLNYYYRQDTSGAINVVDGVIDETANPFILDEDHYDQKMAVNANGTTDEVVGGFDKKVYFEINLRKIRVKLIDFAKVYGIEDNVSYFDVAVCATGDELISYTEEGDAICEFATGVTSTEHGLSPTHKSLYVDAQGRLKQDDFKTAFYMSFIRALGENTKCPTQSVTGTLTGYYPNAETTYDYDLGCASYASNTISAYQALGVINQSRDIYPGYNYEITYETGDMIILPRTILITPDSNQGFQYGSYTYPTLIPAITFTNSLVDYDYLDNTRKIVAYSADATTLVKIINRKGEGSETAIVTNSSGLVNDGNARICLTNINGVDKFCINDAQDTYDRNNTEVSTSTYVYNEEGLDEDFTTYVFGDTYVDEDSTRRALDRYMSDESESYRYNRNVGVYTISLGTLADKSGNYRVVFDVDADVKYTITPAILNITPDSGQSKIYGQADKELKFSVTTKYKVNTTQKVMYDSSIASIVDIGGNPIVIDPAQTYVMATAGSEITLNGYAYYENMAGDYNYGVIKNSNKKENAASVNQVDIEGKSFDKYCFNNYDGGAGSAIADCSDQKVVYASTTKILVGYLYVDSYKQKAGTYKIAKGIVVADNEFDNQNYDLRFDQDVDFTIHKLEINVILRDIAKEYGIATDAYKCDDGITCSASVLTAQDNEGMLEYNFDITYKNSASVISEGTYSGDTMVLMVNSINGKYYTQSEGKEDKNNYLGISVIRKKNNADGCSISTDEYGCEDAGTYELAVRKVSVIFDDMEKDGSTRYDDNYALLVEHDDIVERTVDNTSNLYVVVNPSSHEVETHNEITIIDSFVGTLEIQQRIVSVFVNTNVNTTDSNYFEIQQNIEVPTLPRIDNSYNLTGYSFDQDGTYPGVGTDAMSTSDDANLGSTYGTIVWGGHPSQVRTSDAMVGEVAYCNQPRNGNDYLDAYPGVNAVCDNGGELVYNLNKSIVNTSTEDKFILITRDSYNADGLKIRPNAIGASVEDNEYEEKNYSVSFYPGAVHVIDDDEDPILVIGNKDYYIEANAFFDEASDSIIGSYTGVDTVLEYLANGSDAYYILANIDENGNLYISLPTRDITISQSSLQAAYGVTSPGYQGIVSGIEQELVYPFTSNYAHLIEAKTDSKEGSYLNEKNITMLEELVTTFIKWFDVDSYDSGQYINGEYLERKFDKYYYIAINKYGYDIANDIDNTFDITKVGTYNVTFYVMDNAGQVSKDGNIARLHIIDTTKPVGGELNLYSAPVKCDSECDLQDRWYINTDKVKLESFNKYKQVDDGGVISYVLDPEGEYIFFTEIGNDAAPYKLISDLTITTINYEDYVDTSTAKYMAYGVLHHTWASNSSGIYLTITGGMDNSYTVRDDPTSSQWSHYYSLDGGSYWSAYTIGGAPLVKEGTIALLTDGVREISITTMDNGVKIQDSGSKTYTFTYSACYGDCADIETHYKVTVGANTYEFVERQIQKRQFNLDAITSCIIDDGGTIIECTESGVKTNVKISGNKFTYKSVDYVILGENVLVAGSKEFKAKVIDHQITLPDGITYRYDKEAGLLYKEYIGVLGMGDIADGGQALIIDGVEYTLIEDGMGNRIIKLGNTQVAEVDEEKNNFELNGITYEYVVHPEESYYYARKSYFIKQDYFKINSQVYTFTSPGSVSVSGNDVVVVKANTNYTNTYSLYDKYFEGLDVVYREFNGAATTLKKEMVIFTEYLTEHVGWNKADKDSSGSVNEELSAYLNVPAETKYKRDVKTAYLDTTAPLTGINIFDTSGTLVSYGDGERIFTHEYGYFNTTTLSASMTYNLRGKVYTIDKDNNEVIDYNGDTYDIVTTNELGPEKPYKYVINYVTYYIDSEYKNIYWLPAYVESYIGGKDNAKGDTEMKVAEIPYYDVRYSVFGGDMSHDSYKIFQTIANKTTTAISSGIGSTKYKTEGTYTLYDFIYLERYGRGIYYKDIDYIVSYVDPDDHQLKKINLNEEFKTCYESNGGIITQDCAQDIIADVIRPRGPDDDDITYDIYYIIRDKAGNASTVIAKGVIYATISPTTNVVIQNIEPTLANSEIVAQDLGNNVYAITANQGVSLSLLEKAFEINYVKTRTGQNYNNQARMTIYKGDEILVADAVGVNYLDYVDSSEIADYKIIYNMTTTHMRPFGGNVDVHGKEVVLHLSILSPKVEEIPDSSIEEILTQESNYIGIVMFIGFILLSSLFVATLILKRKRR